MIPLSKALILFLVALSFGRDLPATSNDPFTGREIESGLARSISPKGGPGERRRPPPLDDAKAAFDAGQYEYAYACWQRILKRDPSNEEAREGLRTLARLAEHLLEEALRLQSREPARVRENLRTATLISDPNSEINRLARKLLGDDF